MPDNLPRNPTTALEWIESRTDAWVERSGAIGLPEGLAQEVADLAADARAARVARGPDPGGRACRGGRTRPGARWGRGRCRGRRASRRGSSSTSR